MEDIILVYEGVMFVVVVIMFILNDGSVFVVDIFWLLMLGNDIGGIICICFNGR